MGEKLLVFSDDERSGKTPREADGWVVGVREAAAFWHVPGESAEIHSLCAFAEQAYRGGRFRN